LRLGTALEQAAVDEQAVGTHALDHTHCLGRVLINAQAGMSAFGGKADSLCSL
jgi:hypothetical protein